MALPHFAGRKDARSFVDQVYGPAFPSRPPDSARVARRLGQHLASIGGI